MALPTVADLKTHLNMPAEHVDDDAELQEVLDAAVDVVEGSVGPCEPTAVTETHYGLNRGVLVLRSAPVVELTAVSSRYGSESTALTLADYEVDTATGIVREIRGGGFFGDYTITYQAGHETLPAALRLAILIVAAQLWETQRVPGATRPGFGQREESGPPMGFAIPNRAVELMAPYRMPVIA